ncbi:efflux RND transporter periplasmic adaptor subunit, partial [Rhizobium sp. TRM95111]|uniref:efflux RND transporter periplasmic adaptor subunit n=1 Tax=Rhizobium alarense TaxID=2846851 RepID=UPI001F415252
MPLFPIRRPAAALLVLAILTACSDAGDEAAGPPGATMQVEAGYVTLKAETVSVEATLPGRVVAYASADIRPRVGGIIEKILYQEGRTVTEGDVLYKIADETYAATVDAAKAALEKAQVSIPTAEANVRRYEQLVTSGGTQIELDNARLTLAQAKADVSAAEASLKSARIDLDLTEVRAPISGITGVSNVSVGNVVTASQSDALTTIKQLDPIYVDLIDTSANLLRLRKAIESGLLSRTPEVGQVHITLEDGSDYGEVGKLEIPEFSVSETTGSFSIRTRIANPDRLLLPGMYVRARVSQGSERGYLVPQLAGSRDPSGRLTAKFLTKDDVVEERVLTTDRAVGHNWLVTAGIADGDRLVVDGFQRIVAGRKVTPVPARVND